MAERACAVKLGRYYKLTGKGWWVLHHSSLVPKHGELEHADRSGFSQADLARCLKCHFGLAAIL